MVNQSRYRISFDSQIYWEWHKHESKYKKLRENIRVFPNQSGLRYRVFPNQSGQKYFTMFKNHQKFISFYADKGFSNFSANRRISLLYRTLQLYILDLVDDQELIYILSLCLQKYISLMGHQRPSGEIQKC